ncbi:MAG: gliding motility protein GldM [Dysgonamonadaceae bacterium]|jgi:gliding motility-associated protein GldM|nr:gliding motility protein GldM [Dysgonamonadaceae bacterium]
MAVNDPNSPRQKMINLMYLVFIGMLALNVSTEVLDGFELVEEGLLRAVKSSSSRNENVFGDLKAYHDKNPEKSGVWYDRAAQVKAKSDSLFNYTQELKNRIVIKADGKDGNPEQLEHPDDLNAAFEVMFERGKNDGQRLKSNIDAYRTYISSMVSDPKIKTIIESNLSTEPSKKAKENKQTWEESMFFQMPVAAAVTLLTKLQSDIRYAEGEVLSDLLKNVDIKDYRVNKMEAFVIPESQFVMRGGQYRADIGVLAVDSTQQPRVFVNGRYLPEEAGGKYVVGAGAQGKYPVSGYVELPAGDGSTYRRDFSTEYYVMEPNATVAPLATNVLYAGWSNDVEIAVPGVATQNISASMSNGTLTPKGNGIWTAVPSKIGTPAVISVTARIGDRAVQMANKNFRVIRLPDPSVYLTVNDASGNPYKFDGGALSKAALLSLESAKAGIDDGILNIPFTILRFELSAANDMGLTVMYVSDGARFSEQQKGLIRGLARGKRVYIGNVVARGPDGSERTLRSALPIIIN